MQELVFYVDDLMYYYQSVVRPVLEYACPSSWHSSLTKEQLKLLEDVQRRALQIIVATLRRSVLSHT